MRVQFICEAHNKHLQPQEGQGPYLTPVSITTRPDQEPLYPSVNWTFDLSDMCCPDAADVQGKNCRGLWKVAIIG